MVSFCSANKTDLVGSWGFLFLTTSGHHLFNLPNLLLEVSIQLFFYLYLLSRFCVLLFVLELFMLILQWLDAAISHSLLFLCISRTVAFMHTSEQAIPLPLFFFFGTYILWHHSVKGLCASESLFFGLSVWIPPLLISRIVFGILKRWLSSYFPSMTFLQQRFESRSFCSFDVSFSFYFFLFFLCFTFFYFCVQLLQ